jgi:hypothetical protein
VVVLDGFWSLWNKEIKSRKTHLEEGTVINKNLWKTEVSIAQFPEEKIYPT